MNSTLEFWRDRYRSAVLRQGLPPIGPGGVSPQVPSDRIFEAGGSQNNRQDLIALSAQLNGLKGRLFSLKAPASIRRFQKAVRTAARSGNDTDARALLQYLRVVRAKVARPTDTSY